MLGVDYLIANEVIIDYKCHCVVIKGNEILFTLNQGIANTIQPSPSYTATVLETVTIPGRYIQLIDIALPDKVKVRNTVSAFIEPLDTDELPQHLLAARTLSPVFNDHAQFSMIMPRL